MATKKIIKVALKAKFPAGDAAKLRKLMTKNNWNALKAGVFMEISPSVIESALNKKEMRTVSIKKIQAFLTAN